MKLLITGGCGFLGSNLAKEALNRGYNLTILDNLSREGSSENLEWLEGQGSLRFICADIRNSNDVDSTWICCVLRRVNAEFPARTYSRRCVV